MEQGQYECRILISDFNFVRAEMIANSQQRRRHLRQTSFSFFLEKASTSNFCCASNQNNPHIPKYVLYDRSRLLQLCGKLFSWAPPVPLGNFYLLAPPTPQEFPLTIRGRGMDIFWNHTFYFNFPIACVNVCLYMYVAYVAHFLWVLQKLSLVGLIVTCCRYFSVSFQSFVLNFIIGDHSCLQH